MPNRILWAALVAATLLSTPAFASPTCLKHHQAIALNADTVTLPMTMQPGSDCIQGLRRSYMQIYAIEVVEAPKQGKLVIVGSGFRYIASDSPKVMPDRFTIAIIGKNRNDPGASIVKVVINETEEPSDSPAPSILSSSTSLSAAATLPVLL